ncbi:hypothetical protein ATCC90586_001278 [Pythium insidiosum]|nr:hypothetical protein ATCC90586_001278 [Pythium insidiosum]
MARRHPMRRLSSVGHRVQLLLAVVVALCCASLLSGTASAAPLTCSASDREQAAAQASDEQSGADAVCRPPHSDADPRDVRSMRVLFVSIAIKGHAQPLLRIASEMHAQGYRVAFATHESGREWVLSHGLPFVSAGAFPISAEDLRTKLKAMTWDSSNFRGILTMFNDIYVAAARPMFDELLPQLATQPPALIVFDIASIGAQDLAHKLQVPSIINSPSIMFDLGGAPSYIPAWGTGFHTPMSLWNRCMNILFPRLLSVALTPPFMQLNKMRWELDLRPYRSQHDIFKGARVILNTAFGLEHPQPLSPLIEPVGPILPLHVNRSHPRLLGSALLSWMQSRPPGGLLSSAKAASNSAPVVYLNLGTMSYIDAWQAEALVEGLSMRLSAEDPPLKVLWVLPTDQRNVLPQDLPPTFKVKSPSVVSSLDVLAHSAVRVVISHCGMVSAQEALVYGKPLLCIPFLVDQPDVAARVVDSGAGLAINKNLLTAGDVHDAVLALLRNETYTVHARRVGRLLVRAGGTKRAIEIIDSALRLGMSHLETLDLSQPWHRVVMLDVWTAYAAALCLLALVIRILWLAVYFTMSEIVALVGNLVLGPPEAEFSQPENDDETAKGGDGTAAAATSAAEESS